MDNTKLFVYNSLNNSFEIDINVPFDGIIKELVYILINKNNVPKYLDTDLYYELEQFIGNHDTDYQNNESLNLLFKMKENKTNFDEVTKLWERVMREEMAEFGEKRCASDEELFATAYHKMVHSPALEVMLQLEHTYAKVVRKKYDEKNKQIMKLSNRQSEEMNKAVERLEEDMTETKINELACHHFEDQTFLQVQLTSELDTMKEVQRREYREWLMNMLEENQANSSLYNTNSPLSPMMGVTFSDKMYYQNPESMPILEESFTIHLGSQLKQMHNIRILSGNVTSLCAVNDNESSEPTPQTLQTALNLYSNDLHGLVLMTDNMVGSRLTKDFKEVCQRSTEFHFAHIDDQLDKINLIQQVLKHQSEENSVRKNTNQLQSGDFYITKHSNLSQVHVIFHIVGDDSLRANDINSRHPVVLGLRNILKTACSNDITYLTIPLLLNYEMSEEMTISWCEKRAELVFKCVKGFMIEMASWGGSDLKNLQFMLPQGISSEAFQSLTDMLPRIFKVSNPLILK